MNFGVLYTKYLSTQMLSAMKKMRKAQKIDTAEYVAFADGFHLDPQPIKVKPYQINATSQTIRALVRRDFAQVDAHGYVSLTFTGEMIVDNLQEAL